MNTDIIVPSMTVSGSPRSARGEERLAALSVDPWYFPPSRIKSRAPQIENNKESYGIKINLHRFQDAASSYTGLLF